MASEAGTYYKFYHYDPSLAPACIFAVLFGISGGWHLFLIMKHRCWCFVPMVIGAICEIVGYAARAVSNCQGPNLTLGPYVVQTLLVLIAPPLFAASMYMTLGRIIVSVDGDSYSLIKKRWLTKVFVTSDAICFFVQLGGAGLMASTHSSTSATGSQIVLTGLLAQIVIFGFFVAAALVFHCRLKATPTRQSHDVRLPWKRFLYILYITSGFILIRNIVRVAEFVEGFNGYIILHEAFLYVFDAVPMAAVVFAFNIWYPSNFQNQAVTTKNDVESMESPTEVSNV